MLPGAVKDAQLVSSDWKLLQNPIDGVSVHEVLHVPRDHGTITEIYRPEWDPTGLPVVQVYQSRLFPGALGAWSCHAHNIDRLFINQGHVKVVLFDGREASPTFRKINEFLIGDTRPTFVVIPPGVWHGVQNLGPSEALMLNLPTNPYNYQDPDHYRLPFDSDEIPYAWAVRGAALRPRSDGRQGRKNGG